MTDIRCTAPVGTAVLPLCRLIRRGILVEQSGSGLIALNEEASWVFAEGSRYRLFVSYLGMDDADGYNKYNFYLYDSETHHLTTLLENTPYESFQ